MNSVNVQLIASSFSILAIALLLDIAFGDPGSRYHPTAWIGKTIQALDTKLRRGSRFYEKIQGALLAILLISVVITVSWVALTIVRISFGVIYFVLAAAILLKLTFALKSMEQHVLPIMEALEHKDLDKARQNVSMIVRRETDQLNEDQVVSASVESVAEGTVDGITSPLFYFSLFGILGAIGYRVVNTLDSMIGYETPKHVNVGFFSAWLDTLANYIPARITALLMVFSAYMLHRDYGNAYKILKRDRLNTRSLNAGWPMSAMAGALNIRLEKIGHYSLGDENYPKEPAHIRHAVHIMKLTGVLFMLLVTIPTIILIALLSV